MSSAPFTLFMFEANARLLLLPPTDEQAGCLECHSLLGGLCEDSPSSATVRRSLSAPHPPSLDYVSSAASCDSQSKFHYDLVARNGGDVYRYPSPLHAVAVQSPAFLHTLGHGSPSRDECLGRSIEAEAETYPLSAPLVSQSSSWPVSSWSSSLPPSHKHLDAYIYSVLQRRALPIRTSRPRTSISTDPSKSILRQASLSVRQVPGPRPLTGPEVKASWLVGGASAEDAATSLASKCDEQQNVSHGSGDLTTKYYSSPLRTGIQNKASVATSDTNSLLEQKPPHLAASTADVRQPASPRTKDTKQPHYPPDQDSGRAVECAGSSQSLEEGSSHIFETKCRKSGSKTVKVKTSDCSGPMVVRKGEKSHHRSTYKKSRPLENGGSAHNKVSKRTSGGAPAASSTKVKRLPPSIPEGRVLDKQTTSRSGVSRHHHGNEHRHGRDQVVVVAKPKHKRNDYRHLRAMMELPYDEACRRVHRRQRSDLYHPSGGLLSSPYSYLGASDSEYSAECASLFHSTIVETSEDEKSNYTTNCFGDSESSTEEYVEESTTTSDTEESGGGGTGGRSRGRNQLGPTEARAMGQEVTPAHTKAFVKIKASHNLKKKILRFRSGSLKLMTTV